MLRLLGPAPISRPDTRTRTPDLADLSLSALHVRHWVDDHHLACAWLATPDNSHRTRRVVALDDSVFGEHLTIEMHRARLRRTGPTGNEKRRFSQTVDRRECLARESRGRKGSGEPPQGCLLHGFSAIHRGVQPRKVKCCTFFGGAVFDAQLVGEIGRNGVGRGTRGE